MSQNRQNADAAKVKTIVDTEFLRGSRKCILVTGYGALAS